MSKKANKEVQSVRLRIDSKLLTQVDEAVSMRPGLSRHAWLIEAINLHAIRAKRKNRKTR
ncbi:MAG TPA: hypothetical protein ENJ44_04975 [Oceanospirillales bacterium]|nr:hypothetical protein [Oceanospirillales bacterium]